jgi:hypothetical protein
MSGIKVDYNILNQKATPSFYADTLANRPSPSYVGRIFVSTDTLDLYRDTGTAWVLLSPSSTGTITGGGSLYRVGIWTSTTNLGESNNLVFDYSTNRLGINTNAPTASLDVHSASNTIAQFNQTTATNDTRIAFQNNGSSLWRIGNLYNAGANDFEIFDVVGSLQSITVKKTTGQVLIGTTSVGSGKLVVSSTSSDNGIQIVGATAPSLRIDSAATGPTKRIGLAIATNTNNFIQGSADRDMCIFNGSTTASPMLFGIYDAGAVSVQEAARISAARNFLIGTATDTGQKLIVNGSSLFSGQSQINNVSSTTAGLVVYGGETTEPRTGSGSGEIRLGSNASYFGRIAYNQSGNTALYIDNSYDAASAEMYFRMRSNGTPVNALKITGTGIATFSNNVLINGTGNPALDVQGTAIIRGNGSAYATHWFTTGAANVAQYYQYNASGTLINKINADGTSFITGGNLLIGTTTDNGNKVQINGQTQSTRISYSGLQSITSYSFGPGTSTTINLPTQFPELTSLALGNVWGISGTATNFYGGTGECVMFTISRNSGGGWSAGTIGLSSATSGAILTSVTGSGDTITLNFSGSAYSIITLQAQVR